MARDPAEMAIALGYAPPAMRPVLSALFGLDGRLASLVSTTKEPQLGFIRLKWWQEALAELPSVGTAGADPVLEEAATMVRSHDVNLVTLSRLTEGWAELFAPFPLDDESLMRFAGGRGGALFSVAAVAAGEGPAPARRAGECWALYDLAANVSDVPTAAAARRLADAIGRVRLPRRLAALAILADWARMSSSGPVSPRRKALAAIRIALIGR